MPGKDAIQMHARSNSADSWVDTLRGNNESSRLWADVTKERNFTKGMCIVFVLFSIIEFLLRGNYFCVQ